MRPAKLSLTLLLLCAPAARCLDKNDFPPVLGGVVRSDKWIVRRDAGQEEFVGNVSYRAPSYYLKSDWALNDKKQDLITLKGSVYINAVRKDGSVLESHSDKADYSRRSGLAHFFAGKNPVRIIHTPVDGKSVMETLSSAALIEEKKSYIKLTGSVNGDIKRQDGSRTKTLSDEADYSDVSGLGSFAMNAPADRVRITHADPKRGDMLALARKAGFDSKKELATFYGDTALSAENMQSRSDLAVYNFKTTVLDLSGGRPVVWGQRNDYDFAMQGDFITINRSSETMNAEGKVRGWTRKQQPAAPATGKK